MNKITVMNARQRNLRFLIPFMLGQSAVYFLFLMDGLLGGSVVISEKECMVATISFLIVAIVFAYIRHKTARFVPFDEVDEQVVSKIKNMLKEE